MLRPGPDGARLIPDLAYARAFTLRVGRTDQSYVDLDDPRRLEFDYLQQIAVVLDTAAPPGRPLRVVHVGGAAMSLARYVAATRPRSAQLVLEPDTELTAFVRTHLPLPARSGIRVRGVDGRSGVAGLRDGSADLVILDAFVGPAYAGGADHPGVLDRRSAGSSPTTGTVIVNVTDRGPLGYARRVLAGLAALLPAPAADGGVLDPEGPPVRQRHPGRVRPAAADRGDIAAAGRPGAVPLPGAVTAPG